MLSLIQTASNLSHLGLAGFLGRVAAPYALGEAACWSGCAVESANVSFGAKAPIENGAVGRKTVVAGLAGGVSIPAAPSFMFTARDRAFGSKNPEGHT